MGSCIGSLDIIVENVVEGLITTNPDENVIRNFRASDVNVDSMFLTRDMLLEPQIRGQINDDCREFRGGRTEMPPYWY